MVILMRLRLTRDQFRALSWVDQRMYIEQLIVLDYEEKVQNYNALSDDEKWNHEEPEMPLVVQMDEEMLALESPPLPDIMEGW